MCVDELQSVECLVINDRRRNPKEVIFCHNKLPQVREAVKCVREVINDVVAQVKNSQVCECEQFIRDKTYGIVAQATKENNNEDKKIGICDC